MPLKRTNLRQLAERVRAGDDTAAAELSERLEPPLEHIIRRVIRMREANSALARRIVQEAAELLASEPAAAAGADHMIREIASRIRGTALAGLRARPDGGASVYDTITGN